MSIPNAISLDPTASDIAERIAALPVTSGVYVLAIPGKTPHVSWSANLPRRLARLLQPSNNEPGSVLGRLRDNLASVDCWATGSKLESSLLTYHLARSYFPGEYLIRLRMRIPWFVGLTGNDPFPRLTVVNRIPRNAGPLFGPFSSRDSAQRYEQDVGGLFQIRRCTEVLTPHPEHPGCIYGEMNQCLRPCQCAVTNEEYASESGRAAEFLTTNSKSAIAVLSAARDRACEQTDFEQAAFLHKRIDRMHAVAALRDAAVTEVRQFNGVALTRGTEARSLRLWPMLGGYWQEPVTLAFSAEESRTGSMDRELRERLDDSLKNPQASGKREEDLAIFSRWYYSSWRDGQWFPFVSLPDLNYRRLVREISNMAKAGAPNFVR